LEIQDEEKRLNLDNCAGYDRNMKKYFFPMLLILFCGYISAQGMSFTIAIPEGNHFLIDGHSRFGFLGINLEYAFELSDSQVLVIELGGLLDFFMPIPAPIDYAWAIDPEYSGSFESVYGWYLYAEYRYVNQVHIGGGLQFTSLTYRKTIWENGEVVRVEMRDVSGFGPGISLGSNFSIPLSFGLNYFPILYDLSDSEFGYDHSVFIDIGWRLDF
jgi:hypothetical protein